MFDFQNPEANFISYVRDEATIQFVIDIYGEKYLYEDSLEIDHSSGPNLADDPKKEFYEGSMMIGFPDPDILEISNQIELLSGLHNGTTELDSCQGAEQ